MTLFDELPNLYGSAEQLGVDVSPAGRMQNSSVGARAGSEAAGVPLKNVRTGLAYRSREAASSLGSSRSRLAYSGQPEKGRSCRRGRG